jgi:hypothetical protein
VLHGVLEITARALPRGAGINPSLSTILLRTSLSSDVSRSDKSLDKA